MDPKTKARKIREYLLGSDDGFVTFDGGDGCHYACRGWDGRSETCDCGMSSPRWEELAGDVFPTADEDES